MFSPQSRQAAPLWKRRIGARLPSRYPSPTFAPMFSTAPSSPWAATSAARTISAFIIRRIWARPGAAMPRLSAPSSTATLSRAAAKCLCSAPTGVIGSRAILPMPQVGRNSESATIRRCRRTVNSAPCRGAIICCCPAASAFPAPATHSAAAYSSSRRRRTSGRTSIALSIRAMSPGRTKDSSSMAWLCITARRLRWATRATAPAFTIGTTFPRAAMRPRTRKNARTILQSTPRAHTLRRFPTRAISTSSAPTTTTRLSAKTAARRARLSASSPRLRTTTPKRWLCTQTLSVIRWIPRR